MRLATPGDDLWMVRVSWSRQAGPNLGVVERYTAVDLDEDDPTPGVHAMTREVGRLERADITRPWQVLRTRVEAIDGEAGNGVAASVYDAARGFLLLGIPPLAGPPAIAEPGRLYVELGDDTWSFSAASAPAQAWALLHAAEAMRTLP